MSVHAAGDGETWDVVVIGGGPAGENAAQYAIQGSSRTAVIVEAELLGGECSYWACMPSKALLRPVELLACARALPGVAEMLSGPLDARVRSWPGATRSPTTTTTPARCSGPTAPASTWCAVAGAWRARRPSRSRRPTARPDPTRSPGGRGRHRHDGRRPAGQGPARGPPWTSRDVTNLREVPERVAVIGGGVVACESTTWLRGLGAARGHRVEPEARLLANQEPFAGEMMAEQFATLGITVLRRHRVSSVRAPRRGRRFRQASRRPGHRHRRRLDVRGRRDRRRRRPHAGVGRHRARPPRDRRQRVHRLHRHR